MTEQLKPCPCCGCEKVILEQYKKDGIRIICKGCALKREQRIFSQSIEWLEVEIIKDWNTRADGWISVDDKLPEIGQECLMEIPVCGKFNLENGKYKGKGIWVGAWCDFRGKGCNYKVNRWMPLPSVE